MRNLIFSLVASFMLCVAFNSSAAPSDKSLDVFVEFGLMANSAPDSVMNERIFSGLVENVLRDRGIKPHFISSSNNSSNGYLDLIVSYLYISDTDVRVLTVDVNGFNRKGMLICNDGGSTWWEGKNLSGFLCARRLIDRLSTCLRESITKQDSKLVHC